MAKYVPYGRPVDVRLVNNDRHAVRCVRDPVWCDYIVRLYEFEPGSESGFNVIKELRTDDHKDVEAIADFLLAPYIIPTLGVG